MKVAGEKIKIARKEKRLSQAELAKGICTQATVSNIENKNVCDSLDIFSSVCLRLDLQVEECIENSNEHRLENMLNKIENLCDVFKYKEAYTMLNDYKEDISTSNYILETKFFYYKGVTSLLGAKNNSEALFYLHRGSEIDREVNVYNILSVNTVGTLYVMQGDLRKAKVYFDKSLELLGRFTQDIPTQVCKIYYSSAKFYSLIKDYSKSYELCIQGIDLNKKYNTNYSLDKLLYEKSFNKYMLDKNAEEDYKAAYYFAKFFGNDKLISVIKKDIEEFNYSL
ncbi:helix-turn-helix transcriptional regulator [Enterococcus rivorum]|uniref:Cro/Cl family transcriptional regulator n=1 Tax=Enterococcus rivorum TaxID=762845 RepID=A0A1E5KWC8_9ENTE|nr:helix-turn-helix transcriptional regulator [Enterococcus rivorum]MBP2099029.1 transcriptional regulator with XRE-family HTH domain [Enterococcus rivorum]OEH82176.1 Cro/Cl family transcriptional regulator [Enterococcus rivorum]